MSEVIALPHYRLDIIANGSFVTLQPEFPRVRASSIVCGHPSAHNILAKLVFTMVAYRIATEIKKSPVASVSHRVHDVRESYMYDVRQKPMMHLLAIYVPLAIH